MKKFTLIELLIVVGIIGILVTILMPSLARARDKAKDVVCLSNQKQIGTLISTYTVTHKGMLPNHRIGGRSYIEFIQKEPTENLWTCPRNPIWKFSDGSTVKAKAGTVRERLHLTSYGYNGWWLGLAEYRPGAWGQPMGKNFMYTSEAKNPSDLLVTADTKPIKSGSSYYWGCSVWYPYRKSTNVDKIEGAYGAHGWRDKMSSVLYLDGHVAHENAHNLNFSSAYNTKWNPDIDRWTTSYE